jgi:hypothetical protein
MLDLTALTAESSRLDPVSVLRLPEANLAMVSDPILHDFVTHRHPNGRSLSPSWALQVPISNAGPFTYFLVELHCASSHG